VWERAALLQVKELHRCAERGDVARITWLLEECTEQDCPVHENLENVILIKPFVAPSLRVIETPAIHP